MTKRAARHPVTFCDAKTRRGTACRRGAGWGTSHPGRGRCKLHGGSTPSHERAAHHEAAIAFARSALGAEVSIDPLGAMLQAVRLAAGTVAYYRAQLAALDADATPTAGLREDFERAVERLGRLAKTALDAGVDERRVRIAERAAEAIALAAEDALSGLNLTPAQRTQFAKAFALGLATLEESIDGDAVEVVAELAA